MKTQKEKSSKNFWVEINIVYYSPTGQKEELNDGFQKQTGKRNREFQLSGYVKRLSLLMTEYLIISPFRR